MATPWRTQVISPLRTSTHQYHPSMQVWRNFIKQRMRSYPHKNWLTDGRTPYHKAKKKKLLCCPHPTKILKLGRSVRDFFFFFLRTVRELSFPIFFLKFLNGENSGGMQSKRIYKSCKCFFKPLNTNFSKFFAQIWHKKKKKKKKTRPCFFALRSVGRGQHNNLGGGGGPNTTLREYKKPLEN